jgi:hypothetical protein
MATESSALAPLLKKASAGAMRPWLAGIRKEAPFTQRGATVSFVFVTRMQIALQETFKDDENVRYPV